MLGTLLAFSNTIDITFVSIEDVTISSPDTVLCDNSTILLSSSTNLQNIPTNGIETVRLLSIPICLLIV